MRSVKKKKALYGTGCITKKGNHYYCIIRINNRPKWFRGGKTKKEARRILIQKMHELDTGEYKELKPIGFADFARYWFNKICTIKVKESVQKTYLSTIEHAFIPYFGNRQLKSISLSTIQNYITERFDNHGVVPRTVHNDLVLLKQIFKQAVREGYLKKNPAEYVVKPRIKEEKEDGEVKEIEILKPEEINRFLLEVKKSKYYCFFLMACLTGMRRGELLGLKKTDIDWHNNQIVVRRSMWRGRFTSPKSKYSKRRIDMTPYLAHELKKHLLSSPPSEMDLVFCNNKGKPLAPSSLIRNHFLPALRRAKLRRVTFHSLRHSYASILIEQGLNLKYIQRQLGHSSIKITADLYGHLLSEANYEAGRRLDNALGLGVRRLIEVDTLDKQKVFNINDYLSESVKKGSMWISDALFK